MKELSVVLNNYLNTKKKFCTCDLYTLTLVTGEVFRFTSFDKDVLIGSEIYSHKPFHWNRDQINLHGAPSVDTLNVTIYAEPKDKLAIGNLANFKKQCHEGILDQSLLKLSRAYFDECKCIGMFDLFEGRVEVNTAGGLAVKLSVKSVSQGLAAPIPTRVFASQSAFANENNVVTSSSTDVVSMLIPLKPSSNVLLQV